MDHGRERMYHGCWCGSTFRPGDGVSLLVGCKMLVEMLANVACQ